MATNTEEIRRKLEAQANQRVNPLLKGLSMLTGGIAGELTGTNEQIRQQRLAKRALMEEQMSALQEERMMERMKAQQDEMLKRQLEVEEKRLKAGTELKRPEMEGYLRSRSGIGGRTYELGQPDIGTLSEMYSFEKGKEEQEQEAAKKKAGYTQINIPGYGTVGGTPEQISAMAEKNPALKAFLSKPPSEDPSFTTTWEIDSLTGKANPTIRFTKPVPFAQQKALVEQFYGDQQSPFGTPPAPGTPGKDKEEKPTDIPGYRVRMK